jgi:hypothetical protein
MSAEGLIKETHMNKRLGVGDALANVRFGDNAIPPDLPGKLWEPKSIPEYAFDAIREQVQEFEKELANFPGAFSVSLTSGGYAMAVDSIRLHGQFIVFIGCDDSGVPLRVVQLTRRCRWYFRRPHQ